MKTLIVTAVLLAIPAIGNAQSATAPAPRETLVHNLTWSYSGPVAKSPVLEI